MIAWTMLLGMITLINVTMVGAIMQLAGNIPDGSLLVILSRYLKKKGEPSEVLLHPMEASARLRGVRRCTDIMALAACGLGLVFTVWALFVGWGPVALAALTLWILAGNLAFLSIPLASLARRARRMEDSGGRSGKRSPSSSRGQALREEEKKQGDKSRVSSEEVEGEKGV